MRHALSSADLDELKRDILPAREEQDDPSVSVDGERDLEAKAGVTQTKAAQDKAKATETKLPKPLKLTYFDDCGAFTEKRHILKGFIARGETSAIIGPPGAGKSALLGEIAVHCAAMIDWRGHRAKEACGVVIFALERGDLYRRRFLAYAQRDKLHGLPIAVADAVLDLLNPACVDTIIATVKEAEQRFGCPVGMIGIDTFAKGIAAGGGDEDKARDQNRAAANLRALHAKREGQLHIALVGHTGKNEDRGARGSNAHLGDVDVMVQISGVTKGNDQPERVIAEYKLEVFEFGRDEDGDPITTAIVSTDAIDTQPTQKQREPKLTANQKTLFSMLHDAGKSGLLTEDWNTMARVAGIGCHRRADLTDIRNALKSKGLVRETGDRWMVDHGCSG